MPSFEAREGGFYFRSPLWVLVWADDLTRDGLPASVVWVGDPDTGHRYVAVFTELAAANALTNESPKGKVLPVAINAAGLLRSIVLYYANLGPHRVGIDFTSDPERNWHWFSPAKFLSLLPDDPGLPD